MSADHLPADSPRSRIIVPLDVSTEREALRIVDTLHGQVGMFKVGLQLYCATGPRIVRRIVSGGQRVFLDLKFHDIPNTVRRAVEEAANLGATLVDVHAAGGAEMIRAAREAVGAGAGRPRLLGITVLTSLDQEDLIEAGVERSLPDQVVALARAGKEAGLDGVVVSPWEIAAIKQACGRHFLVVTPGIRPAGWERDDQKRFMTPGEAAAAGADYLVIGRPILRAADPLQALAAIAEEVGS